MLGFTRISDEKVFTENYGKPDGIMLMKSIRVIQFTLGVKTIVYLYFLKKDLI
jgi:hypothetical protein